MEQTAVFDRANGISFEVRTEKVSSFACPEDVTLNAGGFAGRALSNNAPRTSVNGIPYGGTTYAINAQACTARYENGHPTGLAGRFSTVTDGLSNTILIVERQAACYGHEYPARGVTPTWELVLSRSVFGPEVDVQARIAIGWMEHQVPRI